MIFASLGCHFLLAAIDLHRKTRRVLAMDMTASLSFGVLLVVIDFLPFPLSNARCSPRLQEKEAARPLSPSVSCQNPRPFKKTLGVRAISLLLSDVGARA